MIDIGGVNLPNWIASPVLMGVSFGAVFWKLDDGLSVVARRAISSRLQTTSLKGAASHAALLLSDTMDRIFGEEYISLKCARSSALFSLFYVIVFYAIAVFQFDMKANFLKSASFHGGYLSILVIALSCNIIIDYISLLKSRFFIHEMSDSKSLIGLSARFLLDFVLTCFLFLIIFQCMIYMVPFFLLSSVLVESRSLYEIFLFGIPELTIAIALSTFMTLIWSFLFMLVSIFVSAASKLDGMANFLRWLLPIDTHPVRSVGVVGGFFAFVIALPINIIWS